MAETAGEWSDLYGNAADMRLFTPEMVLLGAGLIIIALGFLKVSRRAFAPLAAASHLTALFLSLDRMGLFAGAGLSILGAGPKEVLFGGLFVYDPFTGFFAMVFLLVGLLVAIGSGGFFSPAEPHRAEYFGLLNIATLGMMLAAAGGDLLTIFVGIEVSTAATLALVATRKASPKHAAEAKAASEAAMKFFVIGALSSAIFIFGISYIYGVTGTTRLDALSRSAALADPAMRPAMSIGIVLILAGLGFKMSAVPFHAWAPDTFQGAPTPVTALLASASKKMGMAAAFRIFLVGFILVKADWTAAVGLLALLTMTVGNLAALVQTSVKRMLAYSSVAQAGYILIGLSVGTDYALAGSFLHVLTHAVMTTGAFFVVALCTTSGVGDRFEDYTRLYWRSPLLAVSMAVILLSLAGIPPFAGFLSKLVLFSGAVQAGGWYVWLAVAGVLNSALSLYYYVKVIKFMFVSGAESAAHPAGRTAHDGAVPQSPSSNPQSKIQNPKSDDEPSGPVHRPLRLSSRALMSGVVLCFLATVLIGVYGEPFIALALDTARSFLGG